MICPHCNREFKPTWTYRYYGPRTKLNCPHCFHSSKVYLSPVAGIVAMWAVLGIFVLLVALARLWVRPPLCLAAALPVAIFMYPFGRLADFKWGKLKPLGELRRPAIATCAECKSELPVEEMVAHNGLFYCGKCKPVLLRKLIQGSEIGSPASQRSAFRTRWFWILIFSMLLASWLFYTYFLTL